MSKKSKAYQAPTHAEIAAVAQLIYEREGRPEGKATEHWLQAEAKLIAERKAASASPASGASNAPSWEPSSRQSLRRN
jgi:hypothetical protein